MITGIKKDQHVFTDYSYIPLTLAAPALVGFNKDKTAVNVVRVMSLTALGYSLLTDAKWGAWKLIPYKTHGVLDLVSGVTALAAPWVFKFSADKKARNTLLVMGVIGVVVGALSIIGSKKAKSPSVGVAIKRSTFKEISRHSIIKLNRVLHT